MALRALKSWEVMYEIKANSFNQSMQLTRKAVLCICTPTDNLWKKETWSGQNIPSSYELCTKCVPLQLADVSWASDFPKHLGLYDDAPGCWSGNTGAKVVACIGQQQARSMAVESPAGSSSVLGLTAVPASNLQSHPAGFPESPPLQEGSSRLAALEAPVLLMAVAALGAGDSLWDSISVDAWASPSHALRGHDSVRGVHFVQSPGLMRPFSIPIQITLQGSRRHQGRWVATRISQPIRGILLNRG
jgi:hypothetical protein